MAITTTKPAPNKNKRPLRGALYWGAAALCVTALILLYFIDPAKHPLLPCAIHTLTGLYCPGCGTTRMLHLLLTGDIARAFFMNPFMLCVLPLVGYYLLAEGLPDMTGGRLRIPRLKLGMGFAIALAAATVAFIILRNIPGGLFIPN